MTTIAIPRLALVKNSKYASALDHLIRATNQWVVARDYAGYEPYDLLNSRYFGRWATKQPWATLFLQLGRRVGGLRLRQWLEVPESRNPKALALVLGAYCDLARGGWDTSALCAHVIELLDELRSPGETDFCWGYDWHYVSLRGARLPAFSPNSIATVFAAEALLDHAEVFKNEKSRRMAESATRWLAERLTLSVNEPDEICFSYTPDSVTRIFNNSALIGALLARLSRQPEHRGYRATARRAIAFLANHQSRDGSWPYGMAASQSWIDSFHTGYNLCALREYETSTGDRSFHDVAARGYEFYQQYFFRGDGAPRYLHNRTYPIDIHSCSQAILTFCTFAQEDPTALHRAQTVARWTAEHLRNNDGSFGYQIHRGWTDRTPYVRWSQAWMLKALAALRRHEADLA